MNPDKNKKREKTDEELNADWQGVDKDPAEERGKKEKVTKEDLKGKKVDEDLTKESDKPLDRPFTS